MVCDNCKIGLSFNSTCFHCGEDWKDRFVTTILKTPIKNLDKKLRYELVCLEEEVLENYNENE